MMHTAFQPANSTLLTSSRHEDLVYQAMTIAAMVIVLVSVWVF